jgi:hypothetical protein
MYTKTISITALAILASTLSLTSALPQPQISATETAINATPVSNMTDAMAQATVPAATPLAAPTQVVSAPAPLDDDGYVASEPDETESAQMNPEDAESSETEPEQAQTASPDESDYETAAPDEAEAEGASPDAEDGEAAAPDYEDGDAAEGEGAEYEGGAQVAAAPTEEEQDYQPQEATIASGRRDGRRGKKIRYRKKKDEERWRRGIVRNRIRSLRGSGEKKAYGKTYYHKKTDYPYVFFSIPNLFLVNVLPKKGIFH